MRKRQSKPKPPWTCRKCKTKTANRRLRICPKCGTKRPPKKYSKHQLLLIENRLRYEEILAAQGGVCALCKKPPKDKKLDIDHDHKRMVVRGLLCHRCNRFLPSWMDRDWLLRAADYVISEA